MKKKILLSLFTLFLICLFFNLKTYASNETLSYTVYDISDNIIGTLDLSNLEDYSFVICGVADERGDGFIYGNYVISNGPLYVSSNDFTNYQDIHFSTDPGYTLKYLFGPNLTIDSFQNYINNINDQSFANSSLTSTYISVCASLLPSFSNSSVVNYPDIYFEDTKDVALSNSFNFFDNPSIRNKEDVQNLNFDNMFIDLNDYDSKDRLYLHMLTLNTTVDLDDTNKMYYYNDIVFGLDFFTSYYNNDIDNPGYTIPKYKFELDNNKEYYFVLSSSASSITNYYNAYDYTRDENAFDGFGFSTGENFTSDEILQDIQQNQNDKLEEQNQTSKGIWDTIKEILSYLNPFSENFFAYKLVELILNGIKSLFIPKDDFFSNFFTELKNWFSERFGLLFYPFELIIDILNKILNINLSDPAFSIPEIKEPSTGKVLFAARHYDFNSLLENSVFKTMHDIYFIIVDAIIVFALINLIKRKLEEVETK